MSSVRTYGLFSTAFVKVVITESVARRALLTVCGYAVVAATRSINIMVSRFIASNDIISFEYCCFWVQTVNVMFAELLQYCCHPTARRNLKTVCRQTVIPVGSFRRRVY